MGRDGLYTAGPNLSSQRPKSVTGTDLPGNKHGADVAAKIIGFAGNQVAMSPGGSMNVAELVRLVGGNFISGELLLPHSWTEEFTGSGATSTTDGELVITTGTTADSAARVQSFRKSRFITATYNLSHQAVSTPNRANANVTRRWGCFDPVGGITDGIFVELTGNGVDANYDFVRYKNGSEVDRLLEANWPGSGATGLLVKSDNVSIWEIEYNAGRFFLLQNGNYVASLASIADAAFGEAHLRVGHSIENDSGNIVDNMLLTRGSSISRFSSHSAVPEPFVIVATGTFQIKNSPGRLHSVVITDKALGAASLDVYDTRDLIGGLIPANLHVSPIASTNVQGPLPFNTEFTEGLVVVVSGNNIGITIAFD